MIICKNIDEASLTIKEMMKEKKFGSAGEKIIIEEFIEGFEISFFAFIDKNSFLPLGYALDHKRAFDGDSGPNTGGMGCFYPSKKMNKNIENKIIDHVLKRTFLGLKNENITYRGVLFFGLMIKNNEPYVIEYNARFGDPECQTLLRNLKTDLLKIFISTTEDKLHTQNIENFNKSVVCVVLASNGYPGNYNKNKIIENLKNLRIKRHSYFHAGTKLVLIIMFPMEACFINPATANNIEDARKKHTRRLKN